MTNDDSQLAQEVKKDLGEIRSYNSANLFSCLLMPNKSEPVAFHRTDASMGAHTMPVSLLNP